MQRRRSNYCSAQTHFVNNLENNTKHLSFFDRFLGSVYFQGTVLPRKQFVNSLSIASYVHHLDYDNSCARIFVFHVSVSRDETLSLPPPLLPFFECRPRRFRNPFHFSLSYITNRNMSPFSPSFTLALSSIDSTIVLSSFHFPLSSTLNYHHQHVFFSLIPTSPC